MRSRLVRDRARLVDIALRAAWIRHAGRFADDLRWSPSAATAAASCTRARTSTSWCCSEERFLDWQPDIERFLTFLWDIGLEVGHSVRSIDDCQRESLADISVATTLFEARLLAGPESLFAGMRRALAPDRLWSSQDFFEAKCREQTSATTGTSTPRTTSNRTSSRARGIARRPDHRLGGEASFRHGHAG